MSVYRSCKPFPIFQNYDLWWIHVDVLFGLAIVISMTEGVSEREGFAASCRNVFGALGFASLCLYSEVPHPALLGVGLNSLLVAVLCEAAVQGSNGAETQTATAD